jgi:hypothetical protein
MNNSTLTSSAEVLQNPEAEKFSITSFAKESMQKVLDTTKEGYKEMGFFESIKKGGKEFLKFIAENSISLIEKIFGKNGITDWLREKLSLEASETEVSLLETVLENSPFKGLGESLKNTFGNFMKLSEMITILQKPDGALILAGKLWDIAKENSIHITGKLKEVLENILGKTWEVVSTLAEKGFEKTVGTLISFLEEHKIPVPDILKNITSEEIMKTLGNNYETYLKTGGVWFVLWKFLGMKKAVITSGLYFAFLKAGDEDFRKYVRKEIDEKVPEGLKPVINTVLDNRFIDSALDYAKENPLKMAVGTGFLFSFRGFLFKMAKMPYAMATKFPMFSLLLGAGMLLKRRDILLSLADVFYGKNPTEPNEIKEKETFIKEWQESLWLSENPSHGENFGTDFIDSITERPKEFYEKLKSGEIAFQINEKGVFLIGEGLKTFNPALVFLNLTQKQGARFMEIFQTDEGKKTWGEIAEQAVFTGTGVIISGRMAIGSLKGYGSVYSHAGFRGLLKTTIPGTKEFNMLIKGALKELPGVNIISKGAEAVKTGVKNSFDNLVQKHNIAKLEIQNFKKISQSAENFAFREPKRAIRVLNNLGSSKNISSERLAGTMEGVHKGVEKFLVQNKGKEGIEDLLKSYSDDLVQAKKVAGENLAEVIQTKYNGKPPKHIRTLNAIALDPPNSWLIQMKSNAKGRLIFASIVATAQAGVRLHDTLSPETNEKGEVIDGNEFELWSFLQEIGPDSLQILLDVLPGVGTASQIYSSFSGEELVSGRTLEGSSLWMTRGSALLSAGADILTFGPALFTGGASLMAGLQARLLMYGNKATRLLSLLPTFTSIVNRLGITRTVKFIKNFNFDKAFKIGGKVLKAGEVGMVGTAIGMAGMSFFYGNEQETQISSLSVKEDSHWVDDIPALEEEVTLSEEEKQAFEKELEASIS